MKVIKMKDGVIVDASVVLLVVNDDAEFNPYRYQKVRVNRQFKTRKGRFALAITPDPNGDYWYIPISGSGDRSWNGLASPVTAYERELLTAGSFPKQIRNGLLKRGAVSVSARTRGGGCWEGWAVAPAEAFDPAVEEDGWYGGSWWLSTLEEWTYANKTLEDVVDNF